MSDARTEPLEELTLHPAEFIQRLKETGESVALTVDGKAELFVHSAEMDQHIHNVDEDEDLLNTLRESIEQSKQGLGRPAKEVLDELLQSQNAPPI